MFFTRNITLTPASLTSFCLLLFHIRLLKNNFLFPKLISSLLCLALAASFTVLYQPLWNSKFTGGQIAKILDFALQKINTDIYIYIYIKSWYAMHKVLKGNKNIVLKWWKMNMLLFFFFFLRLKAILKAFIIVFWVMKLTSEFLSKSSKLVVIFTNFG